MKDWNPAAWIILLFAGALMVIPPMVSAWLGYIMGKKADKE